MVRINIINPKYLADQHLIAEYLELLMFVSYVKKYPSAEGIPKKYCLGKGHIKFFKNKLRYVQKRFEEIKKEMKKRGFKTNRSLSLAGFNKNLINDWLPKKNDLKIIKKRLIEKIRLKSEFYRYYRKYRKKSFLINLIKKA